MSINLTLDGWQRGVEMRQDRLFKEALGLSSPWQVAGIEFCAEKKRLDIHIDFP